MLARRSPSLLPPAQSLSNPARDARASTFTGVPRPAGRSWRIHRPARHAASSGGLFPIILFGSNSGSKLALILRLVTPRVRASLLASSASLSRPGSAAPRRFTNVTSVAITIAAAATTPWTSCRPWRLPRSLPWVQPYANPTRADSEALELTPGVSEAATLALRVSTAMTLAAGVSGPEAPSIGVLGLLPIGIRVPGSSPSSPSPSPSPPW
jgi:hypothetical protein